MVRRRILFSLLISLSILVSASESPAVNRRAITEKDLFRFTWIGDPQISPDGSRVAFVRVTVNEKHEGYDTSIWAVSTTALNQSPQRLTIGPHDLSPRWSPDGSKLLFLRGTEKEGKPEPGQLAVLSMSGGEPRIVTTLPKGVSSPAWSPDGSSIVFLSKTNAEDLAKAKAKKKPQEANPASDDDSERESDVRVITRAIYRSNNDGYLDPKRHSHIWRIAVPTLPEDKAEPKQLTQGDFDEQDPNWSRDGSRIYFTSTRVAEPYYDPPVSSLYAIAANGGSIAQVAAINGVISEASPSPDGKRIAFRGFLSRPILSYSQPHLFVTDAVAGSAPKDVSSALDTDVGSGLTGDQAAPRGGRASRPLWSKDNRSVIEVVAEKGTANLRRFDTLTGRIEALTSGNQDVMSYTATPDGSKVVALISTPTNIGDLFLLGGDGKLAQLTNINQKLFSELNLTAPEEFWYTSFDGKKIQGWIQKPPNFDPAKKYPLILNIHGGPHAAYGYTFDHEFQWMAAKGYVVLYPNPRGSTTYGREFGNIIQYGYPGDDFKDLMAGVDEVVRRGYADAKRLGVTGGSGGGVLTNWTITQTDRFAAAVSQRSIADWATFWYTADFTLFTRNWFRAAPWQDPGDFVARSAISHIDKVKTPLMLVEGEADYRTPPAAGGEQMFRALKFMRKPVVMVRFPGETHELSRSGKPWHRVERLEHILNWFDKYLQGKEIHLYDMPAAESSVKPPAN